MKLNDIINVTISSQRLSIYNKKTKHFNRGYKEEVIANISELELTMEVKVIQSVSSYGADNRTTIYIEID